MVVSVKDSATNPYYNCFKEDESGFLQRFIEYQGLKRRQDAPKTYEYNGSIYIINPKSLLTKTIGKFEHCIKYLMDDLYSLDIDTTLDWHFAEFLLNKHLVEL